jgi:hypothetical protein
VYLYVQEAATVVTLGALAATEVGNTHCRAAEESTCGQYGNFTAQHIAKHWRGSITGKGGSKQLSGFAKALGK